MPLESLTKPFDPDAVGTPLRAIIHIEPDVPDIACPDQGSAARTALEHATEDVADFINDSQLLDLAVHEISATDLLLVQLARSVDAGVYAFSTTTHQESQHGFDWEIYVGNDDDKYQRYAVQAKRIDTRDRYPSFRHKVKADLQVDLLLKYAKHEKAIALYCLYNGRRSDTSNLACLQSIDPAHAGCTLISGDLAKALYSPPPTLSYQRVHEDGSAVPLRCLPCPVFETRLKGSWLSNGKGRAVERQHLSDSLVKARNAARDLRQTESFRKRDPSMRLRVALEAPGDASEIRTHPERIAIVETQKRSITVPKRHGDEAPLPEFRQF